LGASPRASRALYKVSKALAAISGRDFVTPDDVRELAVPALCHRLTLNANAAGRTAEAVLRELMETLPVPPGRAALFEGKNG
ncbi:MAG: AAA family ATPase, partial [Oscillospiraceae bacterium]|nr:AAA family ATPase [Oscillospiraceae bacterium]